MIELRGDGRTLIGTAVAYNDSARVVSPAHGIVNEVIAPGAFSIGDGVVLELEHRRDTPLAMTPGALQLHDSREALTLEARLPHTAAAEDAILGIQQGRFNGLSVDMTVTREQVAGDFRTVEAATLHRVAIVRVPAYGKSRAEVRQSIGQLRSEIPANTRLACECHRGDANEVEFTGNALARALDAIEDQDRELLAFFGRTAVASRKAGTLLLNRRRDGSLDVDVSLPDNTIGADIRELAEDVPLLVRPVFDQDQSDVTERDGLALYSSVYIRNLIIGPSIADQGWAAAIFAAARTARRSYRGAVWL